MMTQKKIDRINELYHKMKNTGLTEEEKREQAMLRQEFRDAFRGNLRSQLNNIDVLNEDGTVENLGEKHGEK